MQCEFCVQMLAQACSSLMWALVGQHSASPAAAPRPRLALVLVRSMRWIDFSWQSSLRLPSSEAGVALLCVQVEPPLKPQSLDSLLCPCLPGSGTTWVPFVKIQLWNPCWKTLMPRPLDTLGQCWFYCGFLSLLPEPQQDRAVHNCAHTALSVCTLCNSPSLSSGGCNPCIT